MRKYRGSVIVGMVALLGMGQAAAADSSSGMVLLSNGAAAKWAPAPASLPKGIQISVLAGDPAKAGPFALRLKIPANIVIAPHTHATAETLTVLSGALFHDMGEKLDKSRGKRVSSNGFVFLPADMPHSVWTTAQPAEIEVTGTGPFGLNYINPADDPSKPK